MTKHFAAQYCLFSFLKNKSPQTDISKALLLWATSLCLFSKKPLLCVHSKTQREQYLQNFLRLHNTIKSDVGTSFEKKFLKLGTRTYSKVNNYKHLLNFSQKILKSKPQHEMLFSTKHVFMCLKMTNSCLWNLYLMIYFVIYLKRQVIRLRFLLMSPKHYLEIAWIYKIWLPPTHQTFVCLVDSSTRLWTTPPKDVW